MVVWDWFENLFFYKFIIYRVFFVLLKYVKCFKTMLVFYLKIWLMGAKVGGIEKTCWISAFCCSGRDPAETPRTTPTPAIGVRIWIYWTETREESRRGASCLEASTTIVGTANVPVETNVTTPRRGITSWAWIRISFSPLPRIGRSCSWRLLVRMMMCWSRCPSLCCSIINGGWIIEWGRILLLIGVHNVLKAFISL